MAIARTRTLLGGNSEALRLPNNVALGDNVELAMVRSGDVLTIHPAASTIADMIDRLQTLPTLPTPPSIESREGEESPERPGL